MSPRSSPHSSGKQEHRASPQYLVCHTKHEQHGAVSGTFTMTTWIPSTSNILSYPHTHQKGHIPPQLHAWCQPYWSASTGGLLSGCYRCTSLIQSSTWLSLVWSVAWWLYYIGGYLPRQKQPRLQEHPQPHMPTLHLTLIPMTRLCCFPWTYAWICESITFRYGRYLRANLLGKPQCSK